MLEKINVEKLLKTKSKTNNYIIDTVYKRYDKYGKLYSLDYITINKKTETTTSFRWMRESDYMTKNILQIGNPFEKYFTYFKNGNLKIKYSKYIGEWKKIKDTFHHPGHDIVIGKFYEYDIKGQIINIRDYDIRYSFSVYDVIDLMKRNYSKSEFEFRITQEKNYQSENYYWEVIYRVDDKHPLQKLHIDAKTGKVTEKGDFIVIEM